VTQARSRAKRLAARAADVALDYDHHLTTTVMPPEADPAAVDHGIESGSGAAAATSTLAAAAAAAHAALLRQLPAVDIAPAGPEQGIIGEVEAGGRMQPEPWSKGDDDGGSGDGGGAGESGKGRGGGGWWGARVWRAVWPWRRST
jgi:hypothetical protein